MKLKLLTANAEVATVLGSMPAFSETVESEGREMKQCWIQYIEKKPYNPPVLKMKLIIIWFLTSRPGSNLQRGKMEKGTPYSCFHRRCFLQFKAHPCFSILCLLIGFEFCADSKLETHDASGDYSVQARYMSFNLELMSYCYGLLSNETKRCDSFTKALLKTVHWGGGGGRGFFLMQFRTVQQFWWSIVQSNQRPNS
jgi:hypothetical protein